ncbi:MAG: hypothetical protein JW941_11590 [Candidatus Coatesbacteria bacterium]|nr:hypothetical protein [Candidatus Coatesbacteria bacterium]
MRRPNDLLLFAAAIATMVLILVAASYAATDYYVDKTNGSGSNGGASWSDVFASIQKGIDACKAGYISVQMRRRSSSHLGEWR